MSVNYHEVEQMAIGIIESGQEKSSDTPRLLNVVEANSGGWKGCSGEVATLHRLLVAYLYASPYMAMDWYFVGSVARRLKEAQAAVHAEGRDVELDD